MKPDLYLGSDGGDSVFRDNLNSTNSDGALGLADELLLDPREENDGAKKEAVEAEESEEHDKAETDADENSPGLEKTTTKAKRQWARRGYWAGRSRGRCSGRGGFNNNNGRGACRNLGTEEGMAGTSGVKRKAEKDGDEDSDEMPDKTRRISSPRLMSVDSPELQRPVLDDVEENVASPPSERDPPPTPRRPMETRNQELLHEVRPEAPEGADQADQMELPRIGGERRPGPPVLLPGHAHTYIAQPNAVHLVFPTDPANVVPDYMSRGFRPSPPYPFTGHVAPLDRPTVRRTLERAFREEAALLDDSSDIGVTAVMQFRANFLWELGFRRSRFSGNWMYFGDNTAQDYQAYLNAETEVRGRERSEARKRFGRLQGVIGSLARPRLCEEVARVIWDHLQLVRRALLHLHGGRLPPRDQLDDLFRSHIPWIVNANGANGLVNPVTYMPGPAPGDNAPYPPELMIRPEPLPLQHFQGQHDDETLRIRANDAEHAMGLENEARRVLHRAQEMLRGVEELRLPRATERARREVEEARLNLNQAEADRIRAQFLHDRRARQVGQQPKYQEMDENVMGGGEAEQDRGRGQDPEPDQGDGGRDRGQAPLFRPRNDGQHQGRNAMGRGAAMRGRGRRGQGRGGRGGRGGHNGAGNRNDNRNGNNRKEIGGGGENVVRAAMGRADNWIRLQGQKALLPALHAWRRRVRVAELQLMETHPERDHIRRVLESEEAAAVAEAQALIRSEELTGIVVTPNINWPLPNAKERAELKNATGFLKADALPFPRMEKRRRRDSDEEDSDEGSFYNAVPPPNCGYDRNNGWRGRRGGRGGQGGAQQLGY